MADISTPPTPLTSADRIDRTRALFQRTRTADTAVELDALRGEIVMLNAGIARSLARRYADKGEPLADLEQIAMLGLVKAVRRYDVTQETPFLSYAIPTIAGELKRYFRDHSWMIRPPRCVQDLHQRVNRHQTEATQRLGHRPSAGELARELDTEVRLVEEAVGARSCYTPASLDLPVLDGYSLGDALGADGDEFASSEAWLVLQPAIAGLSERERKVLVLRFWRQLTQQEIADVIGATQMQVSRMLSRTLTTLRSQLAPA